MRINKIRCVIYWIVIYPVDSSIHLLNNWVLKFTVFLYILYTH